MSLATATYLALLAPLVGVLVIALGGTRLPARAAGIVGCAAVLASFIGALGTLVAWRATEPGEGRLLRPWTWLSAGDFEVGLDLYVDPLTVWMLLVVTGVGFLIHVYSLGYMDGDPQQRRFFAYLNLFVLAMLILVVGGNLVMLLAGWGLVGMASYLLIGFWSDRPAAVAAAKKAFIVNAVGDAAILLGLLLAFRETGELAWPQLFAALPESVEQDSGTAFVIAGLLLVGAITKSAQIPMHTWLPDAMEGPTPVSALIHAATMVTAGVYAVARLHPVFDLSEAAQVLTILIGAVTLVMAGLIALTQTDIKRVIAYSTMSQIGYMFVAVGIGAYSAAMFHLATHAFFKALLFLGAGIVIHALADEQDVRRMGGLRRHMPKTWALFVVASLALVGVFPFAGFFSKDEILGATLAAGEVYGAPAYIAWGLGLVGALLTGIYSLRLLLLVFHGAESPLVASYGRGELAHHGHGHGAASVPAGPPGPPRREAPWSMLAPVFALGLLTIVAGALAIPGLWNVPHEFLQGADAAPTRHALEEAEFAPSVAWALAGVSMAVGLAGLLLAWRVWGTGTWGGLRTRFPRGARVSQAAFGWDALYDHTLVRPAAGVAVALRATDEHATVPALAAIGRAAAGSGRGVGWLHGGLVRAYAFATVVAVIAIIITFLALEG